MNKITINKSSGRRASGLLTAVVVLVIATLSAQLTGAQTAAPAVPTAPQSNDLQSLIARQASLVTEFEVNGLKVLFKRREGGQSVAVGLFLKGGSRNITSANAGIENLMLQVATEASTAYPRERLRSELARTGTVISSSDNYDYSVLSLTATRTHFDTMWNVFTEVVLRPAFAKEDFDLAKTRALTALADDSDNPDVYLQRLQESSAYAGHPYLNRPEGTVESVSRLNLEDIRRYHQQVMETSRLLLVVVGDLNVNQLRQQVTASFGKLPRGSYRADAVPQLSFSASSVNITERSLPTNYVQGLFSAPPLTSPDIYPMEIASAMLRDRVFEEVRVKRNLSYAPSAFLSSQGANVGGIYVSAVDANQAVRVMLAEISRLQNEPLSSSDITGVVSQYLTTYYLGQETNGAQAADLAEWELIGGGWRNSFETIAKLRAVTPADVQRVSQKYMRNIRFVVLGNPTQIDKNIFTGGQAGI
jgi:predicted Zn-dependent peptidase